MSAHAASAAHLLCSRRERQLRDLAESDQAVAAAFELVDRNGHPYVDALEDLVLVQTQEVARLRTELSQALQRVPAQLAIGSDDGGPRADKEPHEAMAAALQLLDVAALGDRADSISDATLGVIEACLAIHRLTVRKVASNARRTRLADRIARARDEAIWVARQVDPDVTYDLLAELFKRDRTTLLKQQQAFERLMASDEILATRLRRLAAPPAPEGAAVAAGAAS